MTVVRTRREGAIVVLELHRPEALNALSAEVLDALAGALDAAIADRDCGAIVITGAGEKSFAAGADIAALAACDRAQALAYAELGHGVFSQIELAPKAVIAAVNGYALGGGCELALACDIRFASENAVFGQPEVKLGIFPGWGGTQRLVRETSPGFAADLILSGRTVQAAEALERGLVQRVVPLPELLPAAIAFAGEIAARAPLAVAAAKPLLRQALGGDVEEGLKLERERFADLFDTADVREGMQAFLEKRAPRFSGR